MATRGEALAQTALQLIFHADNLTIEKISAIAKDVKRLAASLETEVGRVKKFKIDIRWKSRVINVPIAIDKFKTLIDDLTHGLKEKVLDIAKPFEAFEAGIKLFGKLPADPGVAKITTAFNEVENFIASLNLLVGDIGTALQDALSLTELFDRVLQDIQHLEDLFLPQKSKRTKTSVTYYKRNA